MFGRGGRLGGLRGLSAAQAITFRAPGRIE
jgi:hypothetical protein